MWHKDDQVHEVIFRTSFSKFALESPFSIRFFSVILRANAIQCTFGLKMEFTSATLPLKISLISIEKLRPHEEVIEVLVRKLADDMRSRNEVRDPLIVDQKTFVILDGMHRYASLKQLGCRSAPCCLLEYDNARIKVGSWYRAFEVNNAEGVAASVLDSLGLQYRKLRTSNQIHFERLITLADGISFELTRDADKIAKTKLAVTIERSMVERGYDVQFVPEKIATEKPPQRPDLMIPLPIFSKEEIRQIAETGQLLPHKVTRHVIPSRPLELDVPLNLLTEEQVEDANEKLGALLSSKHIDIRPPGSIVDGRQYQEELLVFTP